MIKLYKLFSWCVVGIIPAISFAGQVAVVNPGAASGVAIVMAPVVAAAPTVAAPTVAAPTAITPTVAAPTATTPISTASAETAPTTSYGSSTQSESNSGAASSAPTSVSGYAPQVVASMQSMNVSSFTPQQINKLVSTIDALISQSGTSTSVRQALISERARLGAIASQ
ncbi:hypothetical protein N9W92_00860 [Planktomarina temperata]|nr:hypothetical protein [Planktomarina temperata]